MRRMRKARLSTYFISFFCVVASCRSKPAPAISFYYWKTRYELNQYENKALAENDVQSLYLRYFDVDIDPGTGATKPVSAITFISPVDQKAIIPVVYIRNRVFEKADSNTIDGLGKNIHQLITEINKMNKIVVSEVQFDCDWTERTKDAFFLFLRSYKKLSGQVLSATIRLHQVKYSRRTGIPPVDQGVLMFYNMGTISASDANSIYEEKNALKYVSSLNQYPLRLDIALPIFSWGIGARNGKVHYLLNKMYVNDFEKDSNFVKISAGRFRAKSSFFKKGYYVMENDEIKIENIGAKDLIGMTNRLTKNTSQPVKKIIFYDLDSSNMINYESNIFQTVSQGFR
jgi:hypothetical protein